MLLSRIVTIGILAISCVIALGQTETEQGSNPPLPSFSNPPLDQEISDARAFEEPLVPVGATSPEENQALGQAILSYLSAKNAENLAPFLQFIQNYPNSAWNASLQTDLGIVYRWNGYFSKAMSCWETAWAALKDNTDPTITAVANRAGSELAEFNSRIGKVDRLQPLLAELANRTLRGSSAEKVARAQEGLWRMVNQPAQAFLCGPLSLYKMRNAIDPSTALLPAIQNAQSTVNGTSLAGVLSLAQSIGMNLQAAKRSLGAPITVPSIVHWKVGHFATLLEQQNGRYLMQDPTFTDKFWVSKTALDEEASGYFLIPAGDLPEGWTSVNSEEAATVWGKGNVGFGDSGNIRPTDKMCKDCPKPARMAQYNFHAMVMSLTIFDSPIGHSAPRGQPLEFTLTYNQRDASTQSILNYSSFGYQWTSNWISYVQQPTNAPQGGSPGDIMLYVAGGGIEHYSSWTLINNIYVSAIDQESHAYLKQISSTNYERIFPDGSKESFTKSSGLLTANKVFLTSRTDALNNLITIAYDDKFRLDTITDSLGNLKCFYEKNLRTSDKFLITKITDTCQGSTRSAVFEYTGDSGPVPRQLKKITDVQGITSEFTYVNGDFINSLKTPYGTTQFAGGEVSGGAPATFRWLSATDPLGNQEYAEMRGASNGSLSNQEAEMPDTTPTMSNNNLQPRNTFFWDKRAMMEAPYDYTKAYIFHWLHQATPNGGSSIASNLLESEKAPLESRIWYRYQGQTDPQTDAGCLFAEPTIVSRKVGINGATADQTEQYQRNPLGKITQYIDAKGRVSYYTYINDIDLQKIEVQGAGGKETIWSAKYDYGTAQPHLPSETTDAAGQTTKFSYNLLHQIQTVTTPKNEVYTFVYRPGDTISFLQDVKVAAAGASSSLVKHFEYDKFGNVSKISDSTDNAVSVLYDKLDRPTDITYLDGTTQQLVYKTLNLEWSKDRNGNWTHYSHNANRQLAAVEDPMGRLTQYIWCGCGSLESIIDPQHQTTTWFRDLEGRVVTKSFAGHLVANYEYEPRSSRLHLFRNARSISKTFGYEIDDATKSIEYSDDTPDITYTFDPNYPRLTAVSVSNYGATQLAYYPYSAAGDSILGAGQLKDEITPDATIHYTYDELGRVNGRFIDGSNGVNYGYDVLGRIHTVNNDFLGNFVYNYVKQTRLLDNVLFPVVNGQSIITTQFHYLPNDQGKWNDSIENDGIDGAMLSKFDYTFDAVGIISKWIQKNSGSEDSTQLVLGYNPDYELTSVGETNGGDSSITKYQYDDSGNQTVSDVQAGVESVITSKSFSENQLNEVDEGGKLPIAGNVNKPSIIKITSNGNQVLPKLDSKNHFETYIPISIGLNNISISATSLDGKVKLVTYQPLPIDDSHSSTQVRSFQYDLDGNTLDDGLRQYTWDGENRVRTITQGSDVVRFTYDAGGRRISEEVNGVQSRRWIWTGFELSEERDASNTISKRYFPEGVSISQGSQSGNFFYTRDHLGSVRELVNGTDGSIAARYDYDVWGTRSKTAGDYDADFGFTGHYFYTVKAGSGEEIGGLYFALYRAYDPSIARWISKDPIGENGGLNLYGYAANDSVNATDPLGLFVPLAGAPLVAGAAGAAGLSAVATFGANFGIGYGIGSAGVAAYDWAFPSNRVAMNQGDWDKARSDYWKRRAANAEDDEFSDDDLARMRQGKPPIEPVTGAKKELHHKVPRCKGGSHDDSNLQEVWPWEHDLIDPYRYYRGPLPSDWNTPLKLPPL